MRDVMTTASLILLLAVSMASPCSATARSYRATSARTKAPDERVATKEDFLKWIKRDAIRFEPWEANPDLSRFLDTALQDKRILFVGEPGHFFSEKYDVQLMLIRYLATKGYRHIFVEGLGASMAPVIDQYVSGVRRQDVATKGASVEAAKYRKRVLHGSLGVSDSEFTRRLGAAQRRFYAELRRISQALPEGQGPLRIHPIDIDMMVGGCYHSISEVLAKYPGDESLDPIRRLAKKNHGETPTQVVKRLEKLKGLVEDFAKARRAPVAVADWTQLRKFSDCLLESSVFVVTRQKDGNMIRALVRREPAMFRQVKHAMDSIPPNAKVIMLAHNNHLTRLGSDTSRARDPSVGEMICSAYPDQVFSIWMLHDHGTLLNPMSAQVVDILESDPLRIESTMVEAGATYLLPLHSGKLGEKYIDRKRTYSYFTWSETATLTKQTDSLLLIGKITPLSE